MATESNKHASQAVYLPCGRNSPDAILSRLRIIHLYVENGIFSLLEWNSFLQHSLCHQIPAVWSWSKIVKHHARCWMTSELFIFSDCLQQVWLFHSRVWRRYLHAAFRTLVCGLACDWVTRARKAFDWLSTLRWQLFEQLRSWSPLRPSFAHTFFNCGLCEEE